jgi:putative transposase
MTEAPRRAVQRTHYPLEVMLMCVRWYAGYPLELLPDQGDEGRTRGLRRSLHGAAARAFFEGATDRHDVPGKITIDRSGSDTAAIASLQADSGVPIEMRQSKYLNNIVEQDHRAIKRITWPMLGFKSFRCARILIAGIETMHMIRKGQLGNNKDKDSSATSQYYSLSF